MIVKWNIDFQCPLKKMVMKKILKDNYFKIHRLKINYCIFFFFTTACSVQSYLIAFFNEEKE